MIDDFKGRCFQFSNPYRGKTEGYLEPEEVRIQEKHARRVVEGVKDSLRAVFGSQGMDALYLHAPTLWADIEASVIEAYREGHYEAWLNGNLEASNKSAAATFRMLTAALTSVAKEDDDHTRTVRILAAHANVDIDALEKVQT